MIISDRVKICSRDIKIIANPLYNGAEFHTLGTDGQGFISIGTSMKNPEYILHLLLHEILECILCSDGVRYEAGNCDDKYLFCFSHDYLSTVPYKLLDAMVSCGLFKIPKNIQIRGIRRRRDAKKRNRKKNNTGRA